MRAHKWKHCLKFFWPTCLSLVVIIAFLEPEKRTPVWKVFCQIPKLSPLEIYTIAGIWLLVFFLPELKELSKRVTKLSIGGVGVEIENLEKKSIKSTINEKIIHGNLSVNSGKWNEAADMFLVLRNSENPEEKIQGLVESAFLLVQLYDQQVDFSTVPLMCPIMINQITKCI